ncbi:MAG: hypothetical protein ACI93T_000968 [Porticoccaceae bacterium]
MYVCGSDGRATKNRPLWACSDIIFSEVKTLIDRLISGGQTGVDRAALAVAQELGVPCGGWCPRGRRAEDGRIPARFPLKESTSRNYAVRTRMNVAESDGTLILSRGELTGGTALTESIARQMGKPWLVIDLVAEFNAQPVEEWIVENRIRTLNVAGPRESQQAGIFDQACEYLRTLINLTAE